MTIISGLPDDTVQACYETMIGGKPDTPVLQRAYMAAAYYVNGHGAPHYQLPVLLYSEPDVTFTALCLSIEDLAGLL